MSYKTFTKYHKLGGAYHWDPIKAGPEYMAHADFVANNISENEVLDVGAGDGYITYKLREKGKYVIGIDNEPYGVELAIEKNQPVILMDIYEISKSVLGTWEAVYLGDIIEHLENPKVAIKILEKITNILYIATPPRKDNNQLHSSEHEFEFTPNELKTFMENLGWKCTFQTIENCRIFGRYEK